MTQMNHQYGLEDLRCYFCEEPFDDGLHPDSLPIPKKGENQDIAIRHYPGPEYGADISAPCGEDRRGWVVYVGG